MFIITTKLNGVNHKVNEKEKLIEFDMLQDDIGTLCICALRYAMGRQTYMPGLVRDIVRTLLPKLSYKDICVLVEDCVFQSRMNLYGDEYIDKPGWIEWKNEVKAEKDGRDIRDG